MLGHHCCRLDMEGPVPEIGGASSGESGEVARLTGPRLATTVIINVAYSRFYVI
jgi:hypothetical protein